MTLQFFIGGQRHAFTVDEARALHAELTAFFGSYVVARAQPPSMKAPTDPDAPRARAANPISSTEKITP